MFRLFHVFPHDPGSLVTLPNRTILFHNLETHSSAQYFEAEINWIRSTSISGVRSNFVIIGLIADLSLMNIDLSCSHLKGWLEACMGATSSHEFKSH